MLDIGRRFAAAVAAGSFCLAAAAAVPRSRPGLIPAQEKTIDLSSVPSASEYRTEEPKGSGFLGSDAAVLGRALARINKALGTSLRPDDRLARLARWVYERLGPDNAMPQQNAFDVLTHRLGLAEPLPHLLMMQAPDAPRLANVVSARLARVFDLAGYTHIGGVAEHEAHGIFVVIAVSRRHIQMGPVPRSLSGPGPITLEGRVADGYSRPELAHTLPGGETRMEPLGRGPAFRVAVSLAEPGRHRVEIVAQGPEGPDVLANFPVYVGVPVDETVEAAAVPRRAARPDDARQRLFELINAERAKARLDALTLDAELGDVAARHSEDMRTRTTLSATSRRPPGARKSDCSGPGSRPIWPRKTSARATARTRSTAASWTAPDTAPPSSSRARPMSASASWSKRNTTARAILSRSSSSAASPGSARTPRSSSSWSSTVSASRPGRRRSKRIPS